MPRRVMLMALLLVSASAVAAESAPTPAVRTAKEMLPAPQLTTVSERKATQRKAGEAPKNSRGTPKPPLLRLEEKNLGLGCAQP